MKQLIVSEKPDLNGLIRLENRDYNYLAVVRRIKKGCVLQVNSAGSSVQAEVVTVNTEKKYIDLKIIKSLNKKNNNELNIILLQWLIKGQHMDLAVRQAAETGISAIFPVAGEFSVVRGENANRNERRRRIIREARQQSGSLTETELFPVQSLETVLQVLQTRLRGTKTAALTLTEENKSLKSLFDCLSSAPETVVLAVGAEGGISKKERSLLQAHNFLSVHLNTNVLRAETAAVYAIAAVQTLLTEGHKWRLNG